MENETAKPMSKTSIRVWNKSAQWVDKRMKSACMQRDAYLTRFLEHEVPLLDEEVAIPNSKKSYDYISNQLDKLPRKLVSISIPTALLEKLNTICTNKKIVRDAFFNRVFLLLASGPTEIDTLFGSVLLDNWRDQVWESADRSLFYHNGFFPLDPIVDPFWSIRAGIDQNVGLLPEETKPTLYTYQFDHHNDSLRIGMSCFLPDDLVPGTAENNISVERSKSLLAELDDLSEGTAYEH